MRSQQSYSTPRNWSWSVGEGLFDRRDNNSSNGSLTAVKFKKRSPFSGLNSDGIDPRTDLVIFDGEDFLFTEPDVKLVKNFCMAVIMAMA